MCMAHHQISPIFRSMAGFEKVLLESNDEAGFGTRIGEIALDEG